MIFRLLNSWLREYLDTKASAAKIAERLSLTSVSVEKIEKTGNDFIYEVEITSNRVDLMSVVGIAREAALSLNEAGIEATFISPKIKEADFSNLPQAPIKIEADDEIVNRVSAVLMQVNFGKSPDTINKRLEASGTRSLNNIVDITNYVTLELGYPCHVFDFDRLQTDKLIIRQSKTGERVTTLDKKEHSLFGGDIIAEDGKGRIVDLLGVMGLGNSVVNESTKNILFFINNNNPYLIRRTSMKLGERTQAAILNEKNVDPYLIDKVIFRAIELYKQVADGKVIAKPIDIFPNKPKAKQITLSEERLNKFIGTKIPLNKAASTLERLGFEVKVEKEEITALPPTWRIADTECEEDLIEEIARIYGYENIPNVVPDLNEPEPYNLQSDPFYWEKKAKDAFKYWGFTEVYTYSLVSEELLEGPTDKAFEISNPLSEEMKYMRTTLVPSLLAVVKENSNIDVLKIFEISKIYKWKKDDLPDEVLTLAGVLKAKGISFYAVKGYIEQLFKDFGVKKVIFKDSEKGGAGSSIYIDKEYLGDIEILDSDLINFELNFDTIIKHASLKKTYKPMYKFPPVMEDITVQADEEVRTGEILETIKKTDPKITNVSLIDQFENNRTFHIVYQDPEKNLTLEEAREIREKISKGLNDKLKVKIKS